MSELSFADIEERIRPAADDLADRSLRYVSSVQDHDLAWDAAWPFICRAVTGRFPWELQQER